MNAEHLQALTHCWRDAIERHGRDITPPARLRHLSEGFIIEPGTVQFLYNSAEHSSRLIYRKVKI